METWVQQIGAAPIATAFVALCGVIVFMGRHILRQHDEAKDMVQQVTAALSANASAMTASAAALTSAREAMQVATAIMERSQK